jgi:hypothetical protein
MVAARLVRGAEVPRGRAPPDGRRRQHAHRALEAHDGLGRVALLVERPTGEVFDAAAQDFRDHVARDRGQTQGRAHRARLRAPVAQLLGEEGDDGRRRVRGRFDAAHRLVRPLDD